MLTLTDITTAIRVQINDTDSGRIATDTPITAVVNRVYTSIVVRERTLLGTESKTKAQIVTASGILALTKVFMPLQVYIANVPLNHKKAETLDLTGLAPEGATGSPSEWYQLNPSQIMFYPPLLTGTEVVLVYGYSIPTPLSVGTDQPIALPLGCEDVLINESSSILRGNYWLGDGTAILADADMKRAQAGEVTISGIIKQARG